jgi:hypothetical protein
MSETLKQNQSNDSPENGESFDDEVPRRLRIRLSYIDFVSPAGALRARADQPGQLELAPANSEVWGDWREDLGRRIARTAAQADELIASVQ